MWGVSVLCFIFSHDLSIPPYINPLLLYVLMAAFLLNPTKTFRHEARFWTVKILGRVLCAPFFFVNFADFWIADQLNSIVPAFLDLQYFICFYSTTSNWSTVESEFPRFPVKNLNCFNYFSLNIFTIDTQQCDHSIVSRMIVAMLPAYFRFAQCLRRYRDTKEAFPHLANAGKTLLELL